MSAGPTGPLVVVGDTLLDRDLDGHVNRLCPDAPAPVLENPTEHVRPGGAALAALLAARAGHDVVLITPLDEDEPGLEIRRQLSDQLELVALPWPGATGEKARVRAAGNTLMRIDRPANPYAGTPTELAESAIAAAGAILVSDHGNGVTANRLLRRWLADRARMAPVVWDPHPRGAAPVPGTRVATPNREDAAAIGETPELIDARGPMDAVAAGLDSAQLHIPADPGPPLFAAVIEAAYRLRTKWPVAQLCITLGAQGAVLLGDSGPFYACPPEVPVHDSSGAGAFFSASLTAALHEGAVTTAAVAEAVTGSAQFLAAGGVAALDNHTSAIDSVAQSSNSRDAFVLADEVRARGGTVAAIGGCFDLLHAGHVHCLRAARRSADCLIVCLSSDASVRALKGPDRPLNEAADRAAVLESLDCVDAVVVCDAQDPTVVLRKLRPDVWIKAGDYDPATLPETPLLRSWGGHVLSVPYLSGRSTTRLVRAAREGDPPPSPSIRYEPPATLS